MSITEKRLDEIQGRLDAATKGPWNHDVVEFRNHMSNAVKAPQTDELGTELVVIAHTGYGPGAPHRNASFMAHARDDVPDLLAEVHRLRAELAKAREVAREKLDDATYAVASAHHPFPSGCLCGYKSARKRDVTEHILDQFIAALGGGDDA